MLSEETTQKLITIAENLQKVYDNGVADGQRTSGGNSSPQEVIYLTNDIRIESREDGIWIVDGEEETHIYDSRYQQLQAQYSDYANEADYAFYDSEGRELKGTTLYEYGDSYAYVVLNDREVLSYDVVDYISVEIPEDSYVGFESKVHFTTPSSVGSDFVQADDICFKGDNTSNGVFTPEADTRYTINFEYNGNRFVGTVSGVPTL